jgi:hypothetical protein
VGTVQTIGGPQNPVTAYEVFIVQGAAKAASEIDTDTGLISVLLVMSALALGYHARGSAL